MGLREMLFSSGISPGCGIPIARYTISSAPHVRDKQDTQGQHDITPCVGEAEINSWSSLDNVDLLILRWAIISSSLYR